MTTFTLFKPDATQICCLSGLTLILLLSGCAPPIGVTKVTPEESYQISTTNPLNHEGTLSNKAKAVINRYNLLEVYDSNPRQALLDLHKIALTDERRDLLFALAEASYAYGESLPVANSEDVSAQSASDVYLQSAVYAYLYLLGESKEAPPSPYDSRFREACDLYNRALGRGFQQAEGDGIKFIAGKRRLLSGSLNIALDTNDFRWNLNDFEAFYPANDFDVYGFTVRNRNPGLGLPIIGVTHESNDTANGGSLPITAFLHVDGNLRDLQAGQGGAKLRFFSAYDDNEVMVNGKSIPLQSDTTAPLAYRLNDKELWNQGLKNFLSGGGVEHNMLMVQPHQPGLIPVVMVHGTGSSPVWWAEMVNTLRTDPVIRSRYQFWFYEYASSAPVLKSAADLRDTLIERVKQFDPENKDPAMNQMVVIGHSQGGLLTNLLAVDSGNKLWETISEQPFESIDADPKIKFHLNRAMFFEHLPFVKRVVYISTPHRGSFLSKDWVRNLTRSLVTLPVDLVKGGFEKFAQLSGQLKLPASLKGKLPTSADGMSPDNPILKALVDLPLAPGITGNSIVAVLPDMDIKTGNDGVVEYSSAHIDDVESEYVVRTGHSAQGHPLAIEEVRRILLKNIN
ncbi:MAG: alpha/beta fold hydrolase [Methylobacter sp.]|nr:alpha/beta fold hydrolase [Methylobacter sp.]